MQAINDNHDPIQELPNEMFSSILSFLPPSSIAHSSAASRLWRSTILSNPTLHQEIDLTSMLANLPILYHYSRLSSLALNQVVKVSLNFTSFYNEFSQNLEQENGTVSALDVLLSMMQNSKETMKELNLSLDELEEEENLKEEIIPFLVRLLQGLEPFGVLQVSTLAPIGFTFHCGDGNPTSKAFIVRKTTYGMQGLNKAADLMNAAQKFTQKGSFRELDFEALEYTLSKEQSLVLLEQLKSSTFTMKRLDLTGLVIESESELWEFALGFKNLESLKIYLSAEGQEEANREIIQVSQEIPPADSLRELEIETYLMKLDWESITRWAGAKLEDLSLNVDPLGRKSKSFSLLRLLYIYHSQFSAESQETHDVFEISQRTTGNDPGFQEHSFSSLNLPNLEVLELCVFASTLSLFADLYAPKLQELTVLELRHANKNTFKLLFDILKGQSATLATLDIGFDHVFDYHLSEPFTFERLEKLKVRRCDESFVEWLSHNHYPELISIPPHWSMSMDLYHKLKPNAPHLKASKGK